MLELHTIPAADRTPSNRALALPPLADTASRILQLRGHRAILDADLAALLGVPTKHLNQQVRRNLRRFPPDFVIFLTKQEVTNLKSQNVTSSWGGARKPPLAYTEHGAIMAASVVNSPKAVEVSVYVVRAFVQLREAASLHKDLANRLDELESRIERRLEGQDQTIAEVLAAIRRLMSPPDPSRKRPIGFVRGD